MEENNNKNLSRRDFLRRLGMGAGAVMASSVMGPLRALVPSRFSSPIGYGRRSRYGFECYGAATCVGSRR